MRRMKTKGTTKKIAEITMAAIPMITPRRVALAVVELVVVPVVAVVVMVAIRIHLLD